MAQTAAASRAFWDRHAKKYAAKPIADTNAYEQSLERVCARLTGDMQALELGCGTGSTALRLAPHLRHLTATDVSGKMIDIAESKRVAAAVGNVEFARATLAEIDAPPGSFDAILGFNYLHLLPDLPAALARARELLKPNGLLITKTPSRDAVSPFFRALIPMMQLVGMAPFVSLRSGGDLEAMIAGAGFTIVETGDYPKHSRYIVATRA